MKLKPVFLILLTLLVFIPGGIYAQSEGDTSTQPVQSQLLLKTDAAFAGYTLFAPLVGDTAYLLDLDGQVVKTWALAGTTAQEAYLLNDGTLLYQTLASSAMMPEFAQAGGVAGGLRRANWDGDLIWSFDYAGDNYIQHHDIQPLPNGDILLIAWEALPNDAALTMGRKPDLLPQGDTIWPDHVVEVNPSTNEIVWRWRVWDHLIQDYDPSLPNYGNVAQHPERIDINYVAEQTLGDWLHTNSIAYNPALDQILLSIRNFSEIWIIDHSTTSEQAASSTGGRSGMGGDLLYRWGNPITYQAGTAADQQLFFQHDAHWIPPGLTGAGDILIFNNGSDTSSQTFSNVLEVTPPLLSSGRYGRSGTRYTAPRLAWEYTANPPASLFAPFISSAQRLANGDTFIADGTGGRFFEVTRSGEIVWDFISGFTGNLQVTGYFGPTSVFRARRYAPDYPGLAALGSYFLTGVRQQGRSAQNL